MHHLRHTPFPLLLILGFLHGFLAAQTINPDFSQLKLQRYPLSKLTADFDLLIGSLKEAHMGLYWYQTEAEFDALVTQQYAKLQPDMNGIDFYNVLAPIVAATNEDHCDIYLARSESKALESKGKFLPLLVGHLAQQTYILENPSDALPLQGQVLIAINGHPISALRIRMFNSFASDGFIESSKYRWLDLYRFSVFFTKIWGIPGRTLIEVKDPATGQCKEYQISPVDFETLSNMTKAHLRQRSTYVSQEPASLAFLPNQTALLSVNTFGNSAYQKAGLKFESFIRDAFEKIQHQNTQHLIIDIRENGGGNEGNEDFLFSFLTDQPYRKYKYVECRAFSFSFLRYTDHKSFFAQRSLRKSLQKEHAREENGRLLRKPGIEAPTPLQEQPFLGQVYVLTSGWTYSGGAEFASLMKQHTDAIFIGEETGGGYYGNTSGYSLELKLPHTGIKVDIPLLKFALDVDGVPLGRGVVPDYPLEPTIAEYLVGKDAVLTATQKLIAQE